MNPISIEPDDDSEDESEAAQIRDGLALSERALREVWDNEEDAVYDQFEPPKS